MFEDSFQNSTCPSASNFTNWVCTRRHSLISPIYQCKKFFPCQLKRLMIDRSTFANHGDFKQIQNQKGKFWSQIFYLNRFSSLRQFLSSFHWKIWFQIPYLHRSHLFTWTLLSQFRLICSNLYLHRQFFGPTFMIFLKFSVLKVFEPLEKLDRDQLSLMAFHFTQLWC